MALSVLHKPPVWDDKNCGVWDSELKKWVFAGTEKKCHDWKHAKEYWVNPILGLNHIEIKDEHMVLTPRTRMKEFRYNFN